MLKKILSGESCANCRLCCVFDRYDVWETPVFTEDIKNKILRHIDSVHFVEDPLRVLRMCRFSAQLDFEIAPETMLLAKKMVKANMLENLSAERIREEFFKALHSK